MDTKRMCWCCGQNSTIGKDQLCIPCRRDCLPWEWVAQYWTSVEKWLAKEVQGA